MDAEFPILKTPDDSSLNNYYEERIVQLFYLLSRRNNDDEIDKIGWILEETLCSLKRSISFNKDDNTRVYKYLILLYKMIAQTRDIVYGKGERKLTYMMIYIWYKFYPILAIYAIHRLVDILILPDNFTGMDADDLITAYVSTRIHAFGSWKDIKYLCHFIRSRSRNHPLIDVAISIMNKQLYRDWKVVNICSHNSIVDDFRNVLSFVAKWVPRENTKFEWVFEKSAIQWAEMVTPYFFKNKLLSYAQNDALLKKCKTNYRTVCSSLNRLLDTTEIKQCSGNWNSIVPSNIPKHTMARQKNALLNVNRNMENRSKTSYAKDRRNCSNNIKEYYKDLIHTETTLFAPSRIFPKGPQSVSSNSLIPANKVVVFPKGVQRSNSNFELGNFVKQYSALRAGPDDDDLEIMQNRLYQIDLLNKQWESFICKFTPLENFIPFVDIHSFISSNRNTLNCAIELACIIASKTTMDDGHIMFSNHNPILEKFDKNKPFYDSMSGICDSIHNDMNYLNDNILIAIDLFVYSLRLSNSSNEDISKMVLVIITNKEYDDYESFSMKFDKEYMPHIIFWNMSGTFSHEIPMVKNIKKTTFVSGYNSLLLNHFRFMGFGGVINFGSFDTVCNFLNNRYYDCMGDYIEKMIES